MIVKFQASSIMYENEKVAEVIFKVSSEFIVYSRMQILIEESTNDDFSKFLRNLSKIRKPMEGFMYYVFLKI